MKYSLIHTCINFIISFFIPAVIVRALGLDEYGILTILMLGINNSIIFSSLGSANFAYRWLPTSQSKEERANLVIPVILVSLIVGPLTLIVYVATIKLMGNVILSNRIEFLCILYIILNIIYSISVNYFRYTDRLSRFVLYSAIYTLSSSIGILIFSGEKILTLDYYLLINCVCFLAVVAFVLKNHFGEISLIRTVNLKKYKESISFGFPMLLIVTIISIIQIGERLIIGKFIDIGVVGSYSLAYLLGSVHLVIPRMIGLWLPITLSKNELSKKMDSDFYVFRLNITYLTLVLPLMIGSVYLGSALIEIYAGIEAEKATRHILPILILSSFILGLAMIEVEHYIVKYSKKIIIKKIFITVVLYFAISICVMKETNSIYVQSMLTVFAYITILLLLIKEKIFDYWNFLKREKKYLYKILSINISMLILLITINISNVAMNLFNLITIVVSTSMLYLYLVTPTIREFFSPQISIKEIKE